MRLHSRLLALAVLFAAQGCASVTSADHVLVTSEPLGARIFVDGEDTGRTTPARLAIGGNFGRNHTIELQKPGYRNAVRRVYQHDEAYTSKWIDGAFEIVMPPLPLFWTTGDTLLPFGARSALIPGELHVQLESEDAPLLGFDLLAARSAAAAQAREQP